MNKDIITILVVLSVPCFIIGLSYIQDQKFNGVLTEVPPYTEKELAPISEDIFVNDKGEQVKVPITDEAYATKGAKNAPQPVLEGYKWLYSHKLRNIEKIPTVLKDNEYYKISSSSEYMIKLPGETPKVVSDLKK